MPSRRLLPAHRAVPLPVTFGLSLLLHAVISLLLVITNRPHGEGVSDRNDFPPLAFDQDSNPHARAPFAAHSLRVVDIDIHAAPLPPARVEDQPHGVAPNTVPKASVSAASALPESSSPAAKFPVSAPSLAARTQHETSPSPSADASATRQTDGSVAEAAIDKRDTSAVVAQVGRASTTSPGSHTGNNGDTGDTSDRSDDGGSARASPAWTPPVGAVARPGKPRYFAAAFARAMPMAYGSDAIWQAVPVGSAGTLAVTIRINEDGKIASATSAPVTSTAKSTSHIPSNVAPSYLVDLVRRTITSLRSGVFVLSRSSDAPNVGEQVLVLAAQVEQVPVDLSQDPSEAGPIAFGYRAPNTDDPGHATFTLRSGRKVTIQITIHQHAAKR